MKTTTKQCLSGLLCLFMFLAYGGQARAQNNALNFDGTDDSVSIPHNSALKPATHVTVEAWVFVNNITSIQYREIARKEDGNDRILFSFQEFGTILSFGLGVGGSYSELDVTITASDYVNRWVHVAAVYNGTQKIIYRNGVVIGTQTVSGTIGTTGTQPLMIGSSSGSSEFFNGNMDEFRFWNVARTRAQIQSGMTTELAGTETGLVVYYNFNEGVANGNNTALTAVNDLATAVGGTNNGTLTNFARSGTTSNWVGGLVSVVSSAVRGNMMSFDGVNDLINAGDINALDGASAITLETWLYIPSGSWSAFGMIMSKQNGGSGSDPNRIEFTLSGASQGGDNDLLVVIGGPNAVDNANYNTTTNAIQYNTWYHVAVVFDGTLSGDPNRLKIYINGVQQTGLQYAGTGSVLAQTPSTNSGALCMGARQGGSNYFRGNMDEARVWNTARTQAQIRENMHLTVSGAVSGLVAYYQFNETSGNAVIDAVGGNNGTLNGASRAESTVSVSKGVATRQTVSTTGNQTFGNATVNFTAMSAPATNDEFVTYQLYDRPLNNVSATSTASNYWIVRQFGTQTFSYNQMSITLPASNVISTTAPASDMKLYKRDHNSSGSWGAIIGTGTSANNTTKVVNYTLSPAQTSFSEFAVASVTSPLPITLLGLKGRRVEGLNGETTEEVKLEWATASEINNKGFEVQVSEDAQTYKAIAFIEGRGNSTTVSSYQLSVINASDAYYRLKQVDFDGTFSYSPVVFVEGMVGEVVVYPNPNNGTFSISVGKDKFDSSARLLNAQGQEIWRGVQTEVRTTGLSAGVYFLHTTVAGKTKITKVVIK